MNNDQAKSVPPSLEIAMMGDGENIYIVADGVRIAKRGKPGTPQAKTWISLEPGWNVLDGSSGTYLAVTFNGVPVH
jgi:hypothetical protein